MTRYQRVVAAQRAEGEPGRMSRVQGMVEERWPSKPYTVWIDRQGRHVSVLFEYLPPRVRTEGVAATWLDAMDAVEAQRRSERGGQ